MEHFTILNNHKTQNKTQKKGRSKPHVNQFNPNVNLQTYQHIKK